MEMEMPKVYINNNGTFKQCEGMSWKMLESYIMIGAEFEAVKAIKDKDMEKIMDIAKSISVSISENIPVIFNSKIVAKIAEMASKEGIHIDMSKVEYKKMPKLSLEEQKKLASWI